MPDRFRAVSASTLLSEYPLGAPGSAKWHHAHGAYEPSGKAGRQGGE